MTVRCIVHAKDLSALSPASADRLTTTTAAT
jgi:hypothetical protein